MGKDALGEPLALTTDEQRQLGDLAIELLGDLVRLDTSNPPGNEVLAAAYLDGRFAAEGLSPEVVQPAPGRGSVVCRLPARSGSQADDGLLLLSHLDVVPAEPEHWSVPPFAAEIRDGMMWGRGTLDAKGLTALQAAVLILLRRKGVALGRDLVLAATADEECGGVQGLRWLVTDRPELLRAGAAINEGGGAALAIGGKPIWSVQTAEKAPCPVRVTATGQPGHAAMPSGDNAVVLLSRALVAIGSRRLPVHITETFRGFVEGVAKAVGGIQAALIRRLLDPRLVDVAIDRLLRQTPMAGALRAMVRNTATPTVVNAGYKINVIPGRASGELDCRLLPGQTPDMLMRELRAVLADAGLEGRVTLETTAEAVPSFESPFDNLLVRHIAAAVARHASGAPVVPLMIPATTDARFLRPGGMPVYGFFPMLPSESITGTHGHNERLSLDSIRFGAAVMWDVVTAYCVAAG